MRFVPIVTQRIRNLVFIRHGQTDWNAAERYQGQLDIPMNAQGHRQAAVLKKALANARFDTVYSSPLSRALETARAVAGESRIILDQRISEIHHGSWQGLTKREICKQWPDQWKRFHEQQHFTPPGAEPAWRVRLRVEEFLRSLKGENILCVSHGVIIQHVRSILLGSSHDSATPLNGSIHTFYL